MRTAHIKRYYQNRRRINEFLISVALWYLRRNNTSFLYKVRIDGKTGVTFSQGSVAHIEECHFSGFDSAVKFSDEEFQLNVETET